VELGARPLGVDTGVLNTPPPAIDQQRVTFDLLFRNCSRVAA
jgi:hypothetical protein